ncbi:hypothetical protein Z946_3416 [Sulfitobacter noctilucicola]|nr:hypothetical protein Z946_3416 [Sulfitobacter noctilucicola]
MLRVPKTNDRFLIGEMERGKGHIVTQTATAVRAKEGGIVVFCAWSRNDYW